jgi:hypothetical protein
MRSLRSLCFDQSNAANAERLPDAWRDLLVDTPRRLVELHYKHIQRGWEWTHTAEGRRRVDISDQQEVDALCTCAALPDLRRLTIEDAPLLYIGRLEQAPLLERLAHLGFRYDRNNRFDARRSSPLVDFVPLLQQARVPSLRFEIGSFHETVLELERGTTRYERARMTIGPDMKSNWSTQLVDEAIRILDVLPSIRELRVTTRRWTETKQVARLRAAATQMKLDVCEVG